MLDGVSHLHNTRVMSSSAGVHAAWAVYEHCVSHAIKPRFHTHTHTHTHSRELSADDGCVHKVAQSRTERKPTFINYYQPHRATQKLEFTNAPCNRFERTERP